MNIQCTVVDLTGADPQADLNDALTAIQTAGNQFLNMYPAVDKMILAYVDLS